MFEITHETNDFEYTRGKGSTIWRETLKGKNKRRECEEKEKKKRNRC